MANNTNTANSSAPVVKPGSSAASGALVPPTITKVETEWRAATFTFSEVPGASGYNVYRNGRYLQTIHSSPYRDGNQAGVYSYEFVTVDKTKTKFSPKSKPFKADTRSSSSRTLSAGVSAVTATVNGDGSVVTTTQTVTPVAFEMAIYWHGDDQHRVTGDGFSCQRGGALSQRFCDVPRPGNYQVTHLPSGKSWTVNVRGLSPVTPKLSTVNGIQVWSAETNYGTELVLKSASELKTVTGIDDPQARTDLYYTVRASRTPREQSLIDNRVDVWGDGPSGDRVIVGHWVRGEWVTPEEMRAREDQGFELMRDLWALQPGGRFLAYGRKLIIEVTSRFRRSHGDQNPDPEPCSDHDCENPGGLGLDPWIVVPEGCDGDYDCDRDSGGTGGGSPAGNTTGANSGGTSGGDDGNHPANQTTGSSGGSTTGGTSGGDDGSQTTGSSGGNTTGGTTSGGDCCWT